MPAANVVVYADKRRHPVRGEIALERLIQISSACLRYDSRGYGMLSLLSCNSVSQYTTKTFTSGAKAVKYGATTEIDTSVKIDGYTPVCITEVKSNHTGSCIVTQFGLRNDGTAFAGIQNNEVNNKGTWSDLKITLTVLYMKSIA